MCHDSNPSRATHPRTPTTSFPHFTHYPGDPLASRDDWQREAFVPHRLRDLSVTVLGLNGIGRSVAVQLACVDVPRIDLVDADAVIPQHLNSEGYLEYDLATYKCDAVAAACIRHNSRVHLRPRLADPAKLSPDDPICEAVVNCVPGREAKRRIREAVRDRCGFYADARAVGEEVEVIACDADSRDGFDTLLDESGLDATTGRYAGLLHSARAAASLVVAHLGVYLRGVPVRAHTRLHLTAGK